MPTPRQPAGTTAELLRNYLSTAIQKLYARNRMEAARLTEQWGWLQEKLRLLQKGADTVGESIWQ